MSPVRHPPGRSGRLWLRRRLATARRGADLLDRKLRILRAEEQRLAELARRTRAEWEESCREAERWLLRAAVSGGERALRPDPGADPAAVEVTWSSVMGTRYPASATCRVPAESPRSPVTATAAVPVTRAAYRTALQAAVAHATADAAARVVSAEVTTTRRRLRAVEHRWVPQLEAALAALEAALDENDSAEGVRLRWAADRQPPFEPVDHDLTARHRLGLDDPS
ncbi:MAG: V-type ATP synthase subunit D [Nocardioidaceae bacterium]